MTLLEEMFQFIEDAKQYQRIATQAQELATEEMKKRRNSDYENRVLRAELQMLRDSLVVEMKKIEAVGRISVVECKGNLGSLIQGDETAMPFITQFACMNCKWFAGQDCIHAKGLRVEVQYIDFCSHFESR